jgi:hypothetical protein
MTSQMPAQLGWSVALLPSGAEQTTSEMEVLSCSVTTLILASVEGTQYEKFDKMWPVWGFVA